MGNTRDYYLTVYDEKMSKVNLLSVYDELSDYDDDYFEYVAEDLLDKKSHASGKWFDYESYLRHVTSKDLFKNYLFELRHKDEDGYADFNESGKYITYAKNGLQYTIEGEIKFDEFNEGRLDVS